MKKALWKFGWEDTKSLLINIDEISERLQIDEMENIDAIEGCQASPDELNELLKESELELEYDWDLEEFLNERNIPFEKISAVPAYPEPKKQLAFDYKRQRFIDISDYETVKVYEWWEGTNLKTEVLEGETTETIVEITDNYVSLDEWDGRNWTTGGMGHHQYLYKIIAIDDEPVETPQFLLEYSSQWQGSHPYAEILTLDEVKDHLEALGRDVEEYLLKVGDLMGE
ncbi:hypothetical protein [Calidifontibacillus erzurumensis]|uniref:hypothetical protein n=1 Tax=Calidifontibacillus erzurumensis TaxID=2741433 RepID=UPI0035B5042A